MNQQYRLAIVSDEASLSFRNAVDICLPLGIRAYELRSLESGRIPSVADDDIGEVEETVKEHELTIAGISPGFFKGKVSDALVDEEWEEGFPRAFHILDRLKVRQMTIFSFKREGGREVPIPDKALDWLFRAAGRCRQEGVRLLVENSAGCWADTGANAAAVADASGCRITWDPGNAAAAGDHAFPDGYQAVSPFIEHVHFKNWLPEEKWVDIDAGIVDMRGQVAALQSDGYNGFYCVEPHQWDRRAEASRENALILQDLLEKK